MTGYSASARVCACGALALGLTRTHMNLNYVPLLQIQRELQGLPRSYERFRQYLRTISPDGARDGGGQEGINPPI
jgi:hypothetical protein